MTFSIAISLPEANLIGAATASRSLAVGAGVIAVRAGIGAVISQAYTNRSLRPYALDRLERGDAPQAIVASIAEVDPRPELRQLAVLHADGSTAEHTGEACSGFVATATAAGSIAIGNLLADAGVMQAMIDEVESGRGSQSAPELAQCLIRCLAAGEAAGGDMRGRQSAAVIVAHDARTPDGLPVDHLDLRIDDHGNPIAELQRLVGLAQ